jgi:hypothetical protein
MNVENSAASHLPFACRRYHPAPESPRPASRNYDAGLMPTSQDVPRMIDFNNKGFFKLKQNNEYAERVKALLLEGEIVVDAYKSMRDGVVFTNKRIIAVNVQGITGSKKDFTSLPYKNIVAYSVETSGTFDLDSELEIYFSALGKVKFEFTGKTSIIEISQLISRHIFG